MTVFEHNITSIYGDKGKMWLSALPNLVASMADKWSLTGLEVMPNLSYNYVLSGWQGKLPVILKLSLHDLRQEITALQAFSGCGVARVLAYEEQALLLERAVPGLTIKSYFPNQEEEAIQVVTKVISRLRQAPFSSKFPTINDWLAALDKNWPVPQEYLAKARKLRDRLSASSSQPVLLHGDLHHDNILKNGDSWLVIDPKGVIGEPAYEVAAFIRNPLPDLPAAENAADIIKTRTRRLATLLNLEETRINNWSYVQAVLAWCWALEDKCATVSFERLTEIFAQNL
jgi:streptomycin 6-kinase